jgi:hypothetical protein
MVVDIFLWQVILFGLIVSIHKIGFFSIIVNFTDIIPDSPEAPLSPPMRHPLRHPLRRPMKHPMRWLPKASEAKKV